MMYSDLAKDNEMTKGISASSANNEEAPVTTKLNKAAEDQEQFFDDLLIDLTLMGA